MKSDSADEIAKLMAEFLESYVPAPWGKAGALIMSRYGKYPIEYLLPMPSNNVDISQIGQTQPNFAVIGMGRCGSHIAVALHQMVFKETENARAFANNDRVSSNALAQWAKALFSNSSSNRALSFKPVMLVGDTDESTFADVRGLTARRDGSSSPTHTESPVLALSYSPLASAGVGHNPIISQYFTRALLLSPESDANGRAFGWSDAKRFLLSVNSDSSPSDLDQSKERVPPRLAFYVFSAGGGTGCGAAAEILRAQQFAALTEKRGSLTYYCAVAVLPEAAKQERRRMLNTGRFIIQYLADQGIILNDPHDYSEVPKYQGGTLIAPIDRESPEKKETIAERVITTSSWNSVLLVSNQIMNPASESLERAIQLSNRYIAQQLFNLAGPQISANNLTLVNAQDLPQKNFEAVRLDAMDLLSSLRGPCACCFAVAGDREATRSGDRESAWIKELFLRAISLPMLRPGVELIEGISIAPAENYSKLLEGSDVTQALMQCSELPFFQKCGSIVFTLTAPQNGTIMQSDLDELMRLCGELFPNLKETRYSAIYGTTDQYTLSLYIEGSAIFAPEILKAVRNYLRLCWPKGRRMSTEDFNDWWSRVIKQDPPLSIEEIGGSLGSSEELTSEYPNLPDAQRVAENSWSALLESLPIGSEQKKQFGSQLKFSELSVSSAEVTAALSFYNYYQNRGWLETLD